MPTLSKELRRKLENVVADARLIAEAGAEQALKQLAVHHSETSLAMTDEEKALREKLRAHGKQLGDIREADRTQEISRLKQACAYEHWHRMLFARYLAENNLLIHPDYAEPITLDEVNELAREENADWLSIAASYAQDMLLEVFSPDNPVLSLILPPETRQKLEVHLAALPTDVFTAHDSLGWVYQFWQRDEKDRVNKSEVDIGADELAAVTQLFTEDYMVLFLLHNTLGAWWTAKRLAEGKDPALPGYKWTYLRLNEGGAPSAGSYEKWPDRACDLRVLDPCMGSGHFLAFLVPLLALMRSVEEDLPLEKAVEEVLRCNLFGLELDARCSQIAAFNLALTSWRFVGRHFPLPPMNLACSGLGINASEEVWLKLAGSDRRARQTMQKLYALFRQAPTLGSLIDPTRFGNELFAAEFEDVRPILLEALSIETKGEEAKELAIAARGLVTAASILCGRFSLVTTNVPYLGSNKQDDTLRSYCEEFHADAKADLATCMIDRCIRFTERGCTVAVVTKSEPLFLTGYRDLRKRLLRDETWTVLARLGPRAFETIGGEVVKAALIAFTRDAPGESHRIATLDVGQLRTPSEKAAGLRERPLATIRQAAQILNPDARVLLLDLSGHQLLSKYAAFGKGSTTGDSPHYHRYFWEFPSIPSQAVPWLDSPNPGDLWSGRNVILWNGLDDPKLLEEYGVFIRGQAVWGKNGVAVNKSNNLEAFLSTGEVFDDNIGTLVPFDQGLIPAILSFCQSEAYAESIRIVDQAIKVTAATLVKVPFDREYWSAIASVNYPIGAPKPHSQDPTQWLFEGDPSNSDSPLQSAVACLLGYSWPRQTGSAFAECPPLNPNRFGKHADFDGIVCLSSIGGEDTAADRLRLLLADAYDTAWSASKLAELLGKCGSLEDWLRDRFFEEHCGKFKNLPFIWHLWDGRKDGFHVLLNYHRLVAPHGEGKKTLEKLIYTVLGDWITRQKAERAANVEGADARQTAAEHLQLELERILKGEDPYDIFVRWKPIHHQPFGWEPDVRDGIQCNIRPWLTATLAPHTKPKKGTGILRVMPKIKFGKDRGKEAVRDKIDFPWFADTTDRNNDIHLSLEEKRKARERRTK